MPTVYVNGNFVEPAAAALPVDERGFLYGDGVFETMRTYGGEIFRAEAHAARMAASARALMFGSVPDAEAIYEIFIKTALLNYRDNGDLCVRAELTRGCGRGADILKFPESCLYVTATPLAQIDGNRYKTGIKAVYASRQRSAASDIFQHKSCSYLENLLARNDAVRAGVDEALVADTSGRVLEGACSNLFLVQGGALVTPPLALNLLPGITRTEVLSIAAETELEIYEREIFPQDIAQADEAFLTNSIQEIVPLVYVGGKTIGSGAPGKITLELLGRYRARAMRKPVSDSSR